MVKKITLEKLNKRGYEEEVLTNPTFQEVWDNIRRLDGKKKSLINIEADNGNRMVIGGGANKYIVYIDLGNDKFFTLTDPSKSQEKIKIVAGGQEGLYPNNQCISPEILISAVKYFYEKNTMTKDQIWIS